MKNVRLVFLAVMVTSWLAGVAALLEDQSAQLLTGRSHSNQPSYSQAGYTMISPASHRQVTVTLISPATHR